MRNILKILLITLSITSITVYAANKAVLIDVSGTIGPATQDFVERSLDDARKQDAKLIILRLDTPGGLDKSMRGINKVILSSSIPVAVYVAPKGARAASAGTFILYASHIAAMAPGTNIGAASPVNIGSVMSTPESENDKTKKQSSSTMEKKVTHDAAAYIRSLAEIQGRNITWAEEAVRQSVSLSAEEALKLHVIEIIANDIPDLLKKMNGRMIKLNGALYTLQTTDLTVHEIQPNWRYQFLSIITDPSVAYILFLIGIYGLFFEFYNPGFILPGVSGGICLLLALYAFQLLPINYAGFGLLLLGIIFMMTEVFVSSFGVLGVGGIIAFIIGSIFLLDTDVPGFNIAWQLIAVMSFFSILFFSLVISLAVRSFQKKIVTGQEALIGCHGEVLEYSHDHCLVKIRGEIWNAKSTEPLQPGQKIQVTDISDLLLTVEPIKGK